MRGVPTDSRRTFSIAEVSRATHFLMDFSHSLTIRSPATDDPKQKSGPQFGFCAEAVYTSSLLTDRSCKDRVRIWYAPKNTRSCGKAGWTPKGRQPIWPASRWVSFSLRGRCGRFVLVAGRTGMRQGRRPSAPKDGRFCGVLGGHPCSRPGRRLLRTFHSLTISRASS